MTYTFESTSAELTEQFASKLGKSLHGGESIELIGDVGAGKTTFVRGLARGIGSNDRVSSPTFTVSNVYVSPQFKLYHYDFYRLTDLVIIRNELAEVLQDKRAIVVLEWAEQLESVLPDDRLKMNIMTTSDTSRRFECSWPQKYHYLEIQKS